MVMKDKLIKNHHKGIYYKSRQFCIGFAVCSFGIALVGVPTYIAINSSIKAQVTNAEGNEDEEKEEVVNVDELESYTDTY